MTTSALHAGQRPAEGLYDPAHEHDACGVGFVVDIKGRKSHAIVDKAIQVLVNLLHRGACGCEPNTGDGAGIVIQMPDRFLRRECARIGVTLPPATEYGAGLVFLPRDAMQADKVRALLHSIVEDEGLQLLSWRDVPTDELAGRHRALGRAHDQAVFVGHGAQALSHVAFERKLYVVRKLFEKRWPPSIFRRTSSPTSRACPATRSSTRAC
jgi:glutamate synthase domain-containing protein 1